MTKKKKRKRPAPGRGAVRTRDQITPAGSSKGGAAVSEGSKASGGSSRSRPRMTGAERREARAAMQAEWIHPPIGPSMAKGLQAVGASPLLVGITFLSVFVIWLTFSAYGVVLGASPQAMVLVDSLPPIHSIVDIFFLAAGRTVSQFVSFAFGALMVLMRAVLFATLIALFLEVFGWGRDEEVEEGDGAEARSASAAIRRRVIGKVLGSLPSMITVEVGSFVLALVALFVTGGFIGPLGVIVVLVGGLYFLVYTPVIVVTERVGVREAARLSYRAARAPGPRHMLMTFSYLAFTLFVSFTTPTSRVSAATPSLLVWGFVLLVSFVHVSMLAAFTYRWLLIREPVIEAAEAAQPRSPRGFRRR